MQEKCWLLQVGEKLTICCDSDSEAVRIAARNLVEDIDKVLGAQAVVEFCEAKEAGRYKIVIRREELGHKEAYVHRVADGVLYISGADRRGMIYGIYELSRMMGVSPWYFLADVPVKHKDSVRLPEGYYFSDYPSVEYRGIFINDEEELDKWAQLHMGEETIGVKTYEKIFEMLLRLRANYIWPAMHVNSFNLKKENGELADRMGIVVGTSHCDMLMRSNNREWEPWLAKKGYRDVEYDYSIPGRNRELLREYWKESVEQNKNFEVGYTLGMRGIHDSGFETKSLEGLEGEELRQAKIELLQTVINDQEKILEETLDKEPLKSFVPYKEVLELYDNGLKVPEDLTLIWTNDNYGYIRRYPGEKEKCRRGGNGIYYHNSYWAPPGNSYLFINSIPLAHTRNELYKAWREGIRKVWVMNVGAIKPLEQEISFYLNFAWEVGKDNALTEDVDRFLAQWINETFSGNHGEEMAEILNDFSQLTNVRKIELMESDVFSQTAYGDEAAVRINRYRELVGRADELYEALPQEERDAFFQICLMKIHAAYYTNCMYYYADRSNLCTRLGRGQAAYKYTRLCREYDDRRRRMLEYYNNVMAEGKWSGILTPEDYPPPRTAMLPACVVPLTPLSETDNALVYTLWNEGEELKFTKDVVKWLELGCTGLGELEYDITLPEWLSFDTECMEDDNIVYGNSLHGKVGAECRILLRVNGATLDYSVSVMEGKITLDCRDSNQHIIIRASVNVETFRLYQDNSCAVESSVAGGAYFTEENCLTGANCFTKENSFAMEDGGIVSMEAAAAKELNNVEKNEKNIENTGKGTAENTEENKRENAEENAEDNTEENADVEVQMENRVNAADMAKTGWRLIKRLGRDHGDMVEACGCGGEGLTYTFYLTEEACTPLLELHRFPSLDSVGRIRAAVSIDGGEKITLESFSNDEWRGNWRINTRNNVDKLTVAMPQLDAGFHELKVYPMDKYFAYSRLVVYTGARKDNMLGGITGDSRLPVGEAGNQAWRVGRKLYGDIILPNRPMYVAVKKPVDNANTVPDTDLRIIQDYEKSSVRRTTPEMILRKALEVFTERNGRIYIDMAAALGETENAYTGGQWDYCVSESYDRTGLAMLIRKPGIAYNDDNMPSLHYRISCGAGKYKLWILTKYDSYDLAELAAEVDGRMLTKEELNQGFNIGRFCGERVYRWTNLWQQELTEGLHEITVYTRGSGHSFDRIYMTTGDELPPGDAQWNVQ